LKLKDAEEYAKKIVTVLTPFCEKITIVGSIRRRRPEVNDIDIVLISGNEVGLQREIATGTLREVAVSPYDTWTKTMPLILAGPPLQLQKGIAGPWLMEFVSPDGFRIDLYRATQDNWGTLLLIRTGSKEHNVKLCSLARDKGLKLSANQGVLSDCKVLASRTEDEIFTALGLPYILPEHREVPQ
jgi:DNA polymerase (family 10)